MQRRNFHIFSKQMDYIYLSYKLIHSMRLTVMVF